MKKQGVNRPVVLIAVLLVVSITVGFAVGWQWRAWFVVTAVLAVVGAVAWWQIFRRMEAEDWAHDADEQAHDAEQWHIAETGGSEYPAVASPSPLLLASDDDWQQLHARREYLRHKVLTDVGDAVTWWLARHPNDVEKAREIAPTLDHLVRLVTGNREAREAMLQPTQEDPAPTRIPPTSEECIGGFLDAMFPDASDIDDRRNFATHVAEYVERWQRRELAHQIRRIGGLDDTGPANLNGGEPAQTLQTF